MSAIRQYSGFDYFITFLSFLMYSLPVFWVAVLLKQYGAIEFQLLGDPVVGWGTIITLSVVSGLIWMGALGGDGKRRLYVLIGATAVTFAVVYFILATGWLNNPSLGIVGVGLTGLAAAVVVTYLSTGLANRRALWTSLTVAVVGIGLYMPLQNLFWYVEMSWLWMLSCWPSPSASALQWASRSVDGTRGCQHAPEHSSPSS